MSRTTLPAAVFHPSASIDGPELAMLPCKISHDGSARVDTFMVCEKSVEAGQDVFTTTFRGRLLKGTQLAVPETHTITLLSTEKGCKVQSKIPGLLVYSHDDKPSEVNSPICTVPRFLALSSIIHQHL